MSDEARTRRRGGLESLRGARLLQAVALAAVAGLAVGFAIGAAVGGGEASFTASLLRRAAALSEPAPRSGWSRWAEPGDGGNVPLRLAVTGLPELPAGETYELQLASGGERRFWPRQARSRSARGAPTSV